MVLPLLIQQDLWHRYRQTHTQTQRSTSAWIYSKRRVYCPKINHMGVHQSVTVKSFVPIPRSLCRHQFRAQNTAKSSVLFNPWHLRGRAKRQQPYSSNVEAQCSPFLTNWRTTTTRLQMDLSGSFSVHFRIVANESHEDALKDLQPPSNRIKNWI